LRQKGSPNFTGAHPDEVASSLNVKSQTLDGELADKVSEIDV